MLTPIKIRGRRKRPWSPNDGVPKPIPSGPKGGRPMLSPEAIAARSQSHGIFKRSRLLVASPAPLRKSRRKLSRLETLPVELIEKIFLYSLNVNLPRCSRSLAAAVSSERIYRALTLFAFWDDSLPPQGFVAAAPGTEISKLLRPLEYVLPLDRDERRALQASILRCRWCTIPHLLNQLPDLMRLTIHRHWLNPDIHMPPEEKESLRLFLARKQDTPRTFTGRDKQNTYTLTITPLVSITITTTTTTTTEFTHTTTHHHRFLSILEIPEKLLAPPPDTGFTPAHIQLLETLRVASGLNQPDLHPTSVTLSREALQQGIHTALIEHNAAALSILLKMDEYTFRAEHPAPPAPATATAIATPYILPADHFRTAVRVARDDPALFQLLLRANAESLPPDDSEITAWAMHVGGALGAWLLDFMVRLPGQVDAARRDPGNSAVFYLGRLNVGVEMGRRYLGEVLRVAE
ncbi:hypothetical protein P175DRAFT_0409451, partial [Aspergillus ochraceoroseus IBT 24754]